MKKNKHAEESRDNLSIWSSLEQFMSLEETSDSSSEIESNSGSRTFLPSQQLRDNFCPGSSCRSYPLRDADEAESNLEVSCSMPELSDSDVFVATKSCSVLELSQTYITTSPAYFTNEEIKNKPSNSKNTLWNLPENSSCENDAERDGILSDSVTEDGGMFLQKQEGMRAPSATQVVGFRCLKLYSFSEQKLISVGFKKSLGFRTGNKVNILTAEDARNLASVESSDGVCENAGPVSTEIHTEVDAVVSKTIFKDSRREFKNYGTEYGCVVKDTVKVRSKKERNFRLDNPLKNVRKSSDVGAIRKKNETGKVKAEESAKHQNIDCTETGFSSDGEITSFRLDTAFDRKSQNYCLDTEASIHRRSSKDGLNTSLEKCRKCSACKKVIRRGTEDEVNMSTDEEMAYRQSDAEYETFLPQQVSQQNDDQVDVPSDVEVTQFDSESGTASETLSSAEVQTKRTFKFLKRFRGKSRFLKRDNKELLKCVFGSFKRSKKIFKRDKVLSETSTSDEGTCTEVASDGSSSTVSEQASGSKICELSSTEKESSPNLLRVSMDEVLNGLLLMPSYLEQLESVNLVPVYNVKIEESRLFHPIIGNEDCVVRDENSDVNVDGSHFADSETNVCSNERCNVPDTRNFEAEVVVTDCEELQRGNQQEIQSGGSKKTKMKRVNFLN